MKNRVNKQIIKALSVGLAASMALQPVTAFAEGTDGEQSTAEEKNVEGKEEKSASDLASEVVSNAAAENKYVDETVKNAVQEATQVSLDDKKAPDMSDNNKAIENEFDGVDINHHYHKDGLDENINDVNDAVADLPTEVTALETEGKKIDTELGNARDAVSSIQGAAKGVNDVIKTATEGIEAADKKITEATSIPEAQKAYDEAEKLAKDAKDAYDAAEGIYKEKKAAYDTAVAEVKAAQKRFDDAMEAANGDVAEAERQLSAAKSNAKALENLAKAAEDELKKYGDDLAQKKTGFENAIKSLEAQSTQLQNDITGLENTVKTLEKEKAELEKQRDNKNETLKKANGELSAINGTIDRLQNTIKDLEKKIGKNDKTPGLKKDLVDAQNELKNALGEKADLETTISGLGTQISGIDKDIEKLEGQIGKEATETEAATGIYKEIEDKNGEIGQIEGVIGKASTENEEGTGLIKGVEDASKKLADAQSDLAAIRQYNQDALKARQDEYKFFNDTYLEADTDIQTRLDAIENNNEYIRYYTQLKDNASKQRTKNYYQGLIDALDRENISLQNEIEQINGLNARLLEYDQNLATYMAKEKVGDRNAVVTFGENGIVNVAYTENDQHKTATYKLDFYEFEDIYGTNHVHWLELDSIETVTTTIYRDWYSDREVEIPEGVTLQYNGQYYYYGRQYDCYYYFDANYSKHFVYPDGTRTTPVETYKEESFISDLNDNEKNGVKALEDVIGHPSEDAHGYKPAVPATGLYADLEKAQKDLKDKQSVKTGLEQAIQNLQAQITTLSGQITRKNSKKKDLVDEKNHKQGELDALVIKIGSNEKGKESGLYKKVKDAEGKLSKAEEDLKKANEELATATGQKTNKEKEIEGIARDLSGINGEIGRKQNAINGANAKKEEKSRNKAGIDGQVSINEQRLATVKEKIDAYNTALGKYTALKNASVEAKKKVKTTQESVESLKAAIAGMSREYKRGNYTFNLDNKELARLEIALTLAEKAFENAEKNLAEIDKQVADAKKDLDEKVKELTPVPSGDDEEYPPRDPDADSTVVNPVVRPVVTQVVANDGQAVLGEVRKTSTRKSTAKAAADTETTAVDNTNSDNAEVAGAQKEETKTPEAPKEETKIEDNETALAATPELEEKGFAWWWLLILAAIAGVSVEEYARRKSNKAKAEAKDSTKINK